MQNRVRLPPFLHLFTREKLRTIDQSQYQNDSTPPNRRMQTSQHHHTSLMRDPGIHPVPANQQTVSRQQHAYKKPDRNISRQSTIAHSNLSNPFFHLPEQDVQSSK